MRVLVTGGGGFLGGAIVGQLVKLGHDVISYSRGTYPELDRLGVEQRRGDLADEAVLSTACAGADTVFHVAAKAGYWGPRSDYYRANVIGTRNVLEACRRHRVPRLIYTSSPSVVFNGRDMEGVDESVPYGAHFKAFYPETKALAERLVLAANGPGLATVALRPHLIWGPGDPHLVPRFLERGRNGTLMKLGRKPKRVDFTYIDNAAAAHLRAFEVLEEGCPAAGRAYFISQNEPVAVWDFINRVLQCGGVPPVEKVIPVWLAVGAGYLLEGAHRLLRLPGEPRMTRFLAESLTTSHWFDISAAERDLGYRPSVTMEEGFRRLERRLSSDSTSNGSKQERSDQCR